MIPIMSEVPLKEHLERLIIELDKRTDSHLVEVEKRLLQRFELVDIAVNKAEGALLLRLKGMNEFREALKDQASQMATRVELARLEEDVQELRREKANLDGRLAIIAGVVSLIVGLVEWWVLHSVVR